MQIKRYLEGQILKSLKPGKVVMLIGPRRVGKTWLLKEIASGSEENVLMLNAEDEEHKALIRQVSISNYRRLLNKIGLLIIDEAQQIDGIGKMLKLMVDEVEGVCILVSGSSSFDLLNVMGEPLTGRSRTFIMHPVSQIELLDNQNLTTLVGQLPERLIYGTYPEVLQIKEEEDRRIYLRDLVQHYLLKDILILDGIRNASKMYDLLRLLAWQLGSEASYHEIALTLGLNKITVEKYLDLLTKVFVLYKLPAFSRNLRKEISKGHKWYFYDNGVRNALINQFAPVASRNDGGMLWENYVIMERMKMHDAHGELYNYYFWRTYDQQEIDLIEERDGRLVAFEIKWKQKAVKLPRSFAQAYPGTEFHQISRENFQEYLL